MSKKRLIPTRMQVAPKSLIMPCEARVDVAQEVIQPLKYRFPYEPMERHRKGDDIHFKFAHLIKGSMQYAKKLAAETGFHFQHGLLDKCSWLTKRDQRQIENFVGQYGLPRFVAFESKPLEPYPLNQFSWEAWEIQSAIALWRALQSDRKASILAALDNLAVLHPQMLYPRPGVLPPVGRLNLKTGEFDTSDWQEPSERESRDALGSPAQFGRRQLIEMVNEHLKPIGSPTLTFDQTKFFYIPKNLLDAMWLMLALDIDADAPVWTCARCGEPFKPKRSTRMYCSPQCASAVSTKKWRQKNIKKAGKRHGRLQKSK